MLQLYLCQSTLCYVMLLVSLEQSIEHTMNLPVIWDAMVLLWNHSIFSIDHTGQYVNTVSARDIRFIYVFSFCARSFFSCSRYMTWWLNDNHNGWNTEPGSIMDDSQCHTCELVKLVRAFCPRSPAVVVWCPCKHAAMDVFSLMIGLHRIATNLGPKYELQKILRFLISWAVVKLLSSDRKLVFTSMSGSDWHTRVNKKFIIGQVIRVTCDSTTTDSRAGDPRTPFVSLSA